MNDDRFNVGPPLHMKPKPPKAPPQPPIRWPQVGWICPVCGRGNAPWTHTCLCRLHKQDNPIWNKQWEVVMDRISRYIKAMEMEDE